MLSTEGKGRTGINWSNTSRAWQFAANTHKNINGKRKLYLFQALFECILLFLKSKNNLQHFQYTTKHETNRFSDEKP
jgi:hypothetical protein